jgi:hypothetical protein
MKRLQRRPRSEIGLMAIEAKLRKIRSDTQFKYGL